MKRTGFKRGPRKPLRKKRRGTSKHKAWDAFSQFIRRRDADENGMTKCFTCGKPDNWRNLDAGHYVAQSISLALRFSEIAVQPQCVGCNRFRHGNLAQYALALRKKYGEGILEQIDQIRKDGQGMRYSESDYQDLYEKYKAKVEGQLHLEQ